MKAKRIIPVVAALALFLAALPTSAEDPASPAPEAAPRATTANHLKTNHAMFGTTPCGALKVWFDAVFLYIDEATRDEGRQALQYLTIPLKDEPTWDRLPSQRTFASRLADQAHHHIFRSYAKGTTPENGYAMDPGDYELSVVESTADTHGRGWKVVLKSSGADFPRPVYLRQSTTTDLWYVDSYANVYVGIRAPLEPNEEQFR